MMTVDLIGSGNMSFREAFAVHEPPTAGAAPRARGGRGEYPVSMKGAAAATRGLAAEDAGRKPSEVDGGTAADRRELERREAALAERWVITRLGVQQGLIGLSKQALGEHIRRMLRQFFGSR